MINGKIIYEKGKFDIYEKPKDIFAHCQRIKKRILS
jgi:hypothetical protein